MSNGIPNMLVTIYFTSEFFVVRLGHMKLIFRLILIHTCPSENGPPRGILLTFEKKIVWKKNIGKKIGLSIQKIHNILMAA